MKIALVCSDRGPCPPVKGGAIQLLISRVAPLLAKTHSVTVFSITDPDLSDQETDRSVKFIRFPQESFFKQVCRHVKEEHFDIIQTYNRPSWIYSLRKASPRSALILSLHNLVKNRDGKEKSGMETADRILTVSRFVARDTQRRFSVAKGKIHPLYTGVDLDEYAPIWTKKGGEWRRKIRNQYNIGSKDRVLLYVGRLVPYKGCHLVIRALNQIVKNHKDVKLLVVGSVWYANDMKNSYLEKLHRLADRTPDRVIFTSYVPVDEIPKYYSASDVFICPSQWEEPLARVHYEAMAAGLPIITTHRGGNKEVIKNRKNGFVIKQYKQPHAFARAVLTILSKPKKSKRMGHRNRELAESTYNFNRVAEGLLSIYQQEMRKNRGYPT